MFNLWVNQHNIRVEDSKTIRLLICTRINDQYEQTWHSSIPAQIRCSYYVLCKDNRKLEPYLYKLYINYLPAIEYTYLNLVIEVTICQSLKYINTRVGVKYSTCTWYLYVSTYLSVLDVLEYLVYGNVKVLVLDQKVLGT